MSDSATRSHGRLVSVLNAIERAGNKLPHPFMLFVYLALFVIVLSWFVSLFGVSVEDPASGETVAIRSLISGDGLTFMLTSMIENFVSFPPLGLVVVVMLGIGLSQKTGLVEAAIKKAILGAPTGLVTAAVIFVGICGNLASDAALIIIPPLAALVFLSLGRHPLAGMAAGFAAAGAGFTANVFIAGTDALLSGISTEAAAIVDGSVEVSPVSNWYFMIVSTLMLTVVGVLVTERIVEPRLGNYAGGMGDRTLERASPEENRALRNALLASVVYATLVAAAVLVPGSPLRNETGGLVPSPFLDGIVAIILLFFVTAAVAYGASVGGITSASDVPHLMGEAMKDLSGFIVLVFAAAQFIAYFEWTNLGTWVAVNGAELLEGLGLTGVAGLLGFSGLTVILSLMIASGSALWAIEAPIFIPLFMLLDINPAFVQVAYRIADSSTNILTPLSPYVAMLLGFMREYDEEAGFGTLFSLMLPYTVIFFVSWMVMLLLWAFLGLPVGPGEGFRMDG